MDNLTHSLVGVAFAECAYHLSPTSATPQGPRLRKALWITAMVGNNLPDLDILYAPFLLGGKLGYLLHHRGHTHTVLFALVLGLLMGAVAHAWVRRRTPFENGSGLGLLWGVALVSPLLHLAMDWMNHYGIHPFWPVWNGWVYGDVLFIIEPLLWASLLPLVHRNTRSRRLRWSIEALIVAAITAMLLLPLAGWYSAVAVGALAIWLAWLSKRISAPRLAVVSTVSALVTIGVFAAASAYARKKVVADSHGIYPASHLHDVVLSPFPANPFCWMVITVETYDNSGRYRLRRGIVAPFSRWVPLTSCPRRPTRGSTAYLSPVPELWGPDYEWEGSYQARVGDLRDYKGISCSWKALLHFARAPFLQEESGALWAGDLRFDFEPEPGFTEIEVSDPEQGACSGRVPNWDPPTRPIF